MATNAYFLNQYISTTLASVGGITDSATTGIILNSLTNIDYTKPGIACLSYTSPIDTSKAEWITYTSINNSTKELQGVTRGQEGYSAKAHDNGVTVAFPLSESHINNLNTALIIGGSATNLLEGMLDEDDMASDSATKGATQQSIKAYVGTAGGAFWKDVPGTPTRVSDTQFTITDTGNANKYDLLFKKGVILKWLESTTFQTAMVISSSYSSDTVTINIVGDSLTAGFTSMKYCSQMAKDDLEFIIPGTLPSAATTNVSRTRWPKQGIFILSADFNLGTAGASTGSTVVDINVSGSSKFTTKPTITGTNTSDIDNVADNPSTEVAAEAPITVDVDSVTATAPVDGYVKLFYYPASWRYR